jgi:hypothetical protein
MFRRTLAGLAVLVAGACSDGTQPELPSGGSFTATLGGIRGGQLTGNANYGYAGTELGESYAVRMFATPHGGTVSFITLFCAGSTPLADGTYPFGPEQTCGATYGVADSAFSIVERADAGSGSMTVSLPNDDEIDGSFSFEGRLARGTDTVGTVSAVGSFRARRS